MKNFYKQGITVVELLVVIAAIGLFSSVAIYQLSRARELQTLKNGVENVITSIDKAREETLSSLHSSSYGVHFESDKVIIFKGTMFSANDPSNESSELTDPATISSISLGTGISDIYFARLSGSPSSTGTITVSTPNYSRTITISATGLASSN